MNLAQLQEKKGLFTSVNYIPWEMNKKRQGKLNDVTGFAVFWERFVQQSFCSFTIVRLNSFSSSNEEVHLVIFNVNILYKE